jgi:hypothetical protein
MQSSTMQLVRGARRKSHEIVQGLHLLISVHIPVARLIASLGEFYMIKRHTLLLLPFVVGCTIFCNKEVHQTMTPNSKFQFTQHLPGMLHVSDSNSSNSSSEIVGKKIGEIFSLNQIKRTIILENITNAEDSFQLELLYKKIKTNTKIKPIWLKRPDGTMDIAPYAEANYFFSVIFENNQGAYFGFRCARNQILVSSSKGAGIFIQKQK